VPIDQLDPAQLGAAAGYEATRQWSTYQSTYRSPLADDRGREKEALAGLAVGEAMKLLSYSTRVRSRHTRREAAEIAAATAERIFAEEYDDPYEPFESNRYPRRRSGSMVRRRSSSFGFGATRPPLVASTTGGSYVTSQPTGASYVQQPGVQYVQSPGVQYATTGGQYAVAGQQQYAGQTQYVTASGQPVQYVQAGSPYGAASSYSTGGGYVQAQPQYVSATGQPVQYATTGGSLGYAQTGGGYVQQPQYVTGQPQYVQAGGQQVVYSPTGQAQQYMGVPQGYTRARALSTGYAAAPGYIQY